MLKGLLLVACFTILISSRCNREAGRYFGRKYINECIVLEQDGAMACNGEILPLPAGLVVPSTVEEFNYLRSYYIDKENRLYICLTNPSRCQ